MVDQARGERLVHTDLCCLRPVPGASPPGPLGRSRLAASCRSRESAPALANYRIRDEGGFHRPENRFQERLGERARLRREQGTGPCDDDSLCLRGGNGGRCRLCPPLGKDGIDPVHAPQREMEIPLGQGSCRQTVELLQTVLQRGGLGGNRRPFQLGNEGIRHPALFEQHLSLPEQSALHPGPARLYDGAGAQSRGFLPPGIHPSGRLVRDGCFPAFRRCLFRLLRVGERQEGRLQPGSQQ